jgi:hypothetical protein
VGFLCFLEARWGYLVAGCAVPSCSVADDGQTPARQWRWPRCKDGADAAERRITGLGVDDVLMVPGKGMTRMFEGMTAWDRGVHGLTPVGYR